MYSFLAYAVTSTPQLSVLPSGSVAVIVPLAPTFLPCAFTFKTPSGSELKCCALMNTFDRFSIVH